MKYFGPARGSRLLLAWDAGAIAYLLTAWSLILRPDKAEVCSRAAQKGEGVPVPLLIVLAPIIASLVGG